MQVYFYSEARQKLALVLDQAEVTGKVIIRRKDGRTFALVPETITTSPLDIPSIKTDFTTEELVEIIREGRERWNKVTGHRHPGLQNEISALSLNFCHKKNKKIFRHSVGARPRSLAGSLTYGRS